MMRLNSFLNRARRFALLWAAMVPALCGTVSALEVSPEIYAFYGPAKKKIKRLVKIVNDGDSPVRIAMGFQTHEGQWPVKPWLNVKGKTFKLASGETRLVPLACKVPDLEGELSGDLLVKAAKEGAAFMEVWRRFPVRLTIKGTEVTRVGITDIKARKEEGGVLLTAQLKNTGNVSVSPKLVAEFFKDTGERVGKILKAEEITLFPNEEVPFSAVIPNDSWDKDLQNVQMSAYFHDHEGKLERIQKTFVVSSEVRSQ